MENKTQVETERFSEYQARVNGITMPYTVTADEIFRGPFSRIIKVTGIFAGIEHVSYTPWAL
jgi:hypothetical protein